MSKEEEKFYTDVEPRGEETEEDVGVTEGDESEVTEYHHLTEQQLLPDNLFVVELVVIENKIFPNTEYAVMLRKTDPLYPLVELQGDYPVFTNKYSGTKFISVIDYITLSEAEEIAGDSKGRLKDWYGVSDDVIASSIKGVRGKRADQYRINAETEYERLSEEIDFYKYLDYMSYYVLYSPLINYTSFSLTFIYTEGSDINDYMNFDNIKLSRDNNIMLVRNDKYIRISDGAPDLETLNKMVKNDPVDSINTIEIIYFTENLGYKLATYDSSRLELTYIDVVLNNNLATVATEEQLKTLMQQNNDLIEFYKKYAPEGHVWVNMTNISAEWVMYFPEEDPSNDELYIDGLDVNMFLYGVTTGRVHNFTLYESKRFIISKELTFVYSLGSNYYHIMLQTYLVDADTLVNDPRENEQPTINRGQGIKISVKDVPDEDTLTALQISIAASIKDYIINEQDRDIAKHVEQLGSYTKSLLRTNNSGNKLQRLQSASPDLFVNGYAKKCQEKNQGIVIPNDELQQWIQDNPSSGYLTYPKEPIPGVQQIHYGCPSDQFPHAGLKRNFDLPNNDKYPLIPCCYAKRQDTPSNVYGMYLNDNLEVTDVSTILMTQNKKQISAVNKILSTFRVGNISNLLLENLARVGITNNLVRMGIYKSNNTLIHCVFHAMKYEPYESIQNIIEREIFVKNWRKDIGKVLNKEIKGKDLLKTLNVSLVRQELYDYTKNEIVNLITNLEKGFNSETLYRILEDLFKINIFVFVSKTSGKSIKLEIPRHKITHIREPRVDRKSIIIFKHSKDEDSEPHYELIIDSDDNELVFGNNVTKKLFAYFHDVYSTQIIESVNGDTIIHTDIYNSYSIRRALKQAGFILSYQYLDDYGKCRGFLTTAPNGESGSILCMPQQPLNLPVIDTIYNYKSTVTQYFDTPSRVDNQSNTTIGLWYGITDSDDKYDLTFYIPLEDEDDEYADLNKAGNPLVPSSSLAGNFSDHVNAEKTLETILRIVTELYRLYGKNILSGKIVLGDMPEKLFGNTDELRDAQVLEWSTQKALSNFKNYFVNEDVKYTFNAQTATLLASDNTLESLFESLISTRLVKKGPVSTSAMLPYIIVFPTHEMKLNMMYFVDNYLVKQHTSFYRKYHTDSKTTSFESLAEFRIWIESKLHPNVIITSAIQLEKDIVSLDKIKTGGISLSYPKPRIYRDPTGVTLIIQNVLYGDLDRAITVALDWRDNKFNGGYYSESKVPSSTPHNTYNVSGDNLIGRNIKESLPSVLRYSNNTYAAILPLM